MIDRTLEPEEGGSQIGGVAEKKLVKTILVITLSATLTALASVFLLAAVRFGITRGELRIDSESQQRLAQLNRAGNIALAFFLASAAAAAWLLLKSIPVSFLRAHGLIKFLGLLIAVGLFSYGLALLGLIGMVPDLITDLERILSHWLMNIAA